MGSRDTRVTVPPCTEFSPFGAPPGVAVDFQAFKAADGSEWYKTRSLMKPRLQLVHTNGASREGKIPSQIAWANSINPETGKLDRTHPHYCVNAPQPTKFVPSNREGIGNYKASDWSIVIETADAGWPTPGNLGGFLYDHAEIVARILAYESIVADLLGSSMPLDYPKTWDGAGTACHTEPFGYPYWTNSVGKPCPGDTKKSQVRSLILPRARVLRAAWLNPQPPEEADMKPFLWRDSRYANVFLVEAANAIAIDEAARDRAIAEGVQLYVGQHDQMLKSVTAKAGLTAADLVL